MTALRRVLRGAPPAVFATLMNRRNGYVLELYSPAERGEEGF